MPWARWGVAAAAASMGAAAHAEDAHLRIVDVGAGLCVIASTPDGHDFLYDAGHWNGERCLDAVAELVADDELDLVVLSHSDSDHLGDLAGILDRVRARIIVHTGSRRDDTATWRNANAAISAEAADEGASVINLETWPLAPGSAFSLGDARAVFVQGWREWDTRNSDSGRFPNSAERRNVISIVMRYDYRGHSVLLTGDTIGRRLNDTPAACRDAEKIAVANAGQVSLRSDVLVASHHGGDNGSAACFVQAVAPTYVVFSAGHDHGHPRRQTADRFIASGVPKERMFRTDLRDHETSEPDEWSEGRINGCSDPAGDDTVDIWIPDDPAAPVRVEYLNPHSGC